MWTHPRYRELTGREPPGRATAEASAPPTPTGTLLASFPRKGPDGAEQELRVILDAYNGHAYVACRLWARDASGSWWPLKGKGVSIRMGECEGVAAALMKALDQAEATPAPAPVEAPPRRRQRPEGRPDWNRDGSPPPPSRGFDDAY